ncbi:MAG: thioredoxin domain-containing protein [Chloroflexi bacterium]|nr:thioredoxin domain-containing protein [Chloroflexota bacterium]
MTKRVRRKKKSTKKRQTNWWVIGGVIVGGLVLVALMSLAFRKPNQLDLVKYCNNNPENCIVEGAADAPVTIVEVSDYGCPHCKDFNLGTFNLIKEQFIDSGQVKWVVMPFALANQFGEAATLDTAVAGMCAAEQDKFPEFHSAAFSLQGTALFNTEAGLMSVAETAGLDTQAFADCLDNNDYEDLIRRNMTAAGSAGISGTPSFYIGDDLLSGNQPFSIFQPRIESLLNS